MWNVRAGRGGSVGGSGVGAVPGMAGWISLSPGPGPAPYGCDASTTV